MKMSVVTSVEEKLNKLYNNPRTGLVGENQFIKNVKSQFTKAQIKSYLRKNDAHQLFKPVIKKFKRDKFYASDINEIFTADLLDLRQFSKWNDGYSYILVLNDVFSKKAYAIPMKNKKSATVIEAFDKFFTQNKSLITLLVTDQGSEFIQKPLKNILAKLGVKQNFTRDASVKASQSENFNRTLRQRIGRLFEATNKRVWYKALDDIVWQYNNTEHSTHGFKPIDVNHDNCNLVYNKLFPEGYKLPKTKPKFKIGDSVRISYYKKQLEKGTSQSYSDEIFKIKFIIPKFNVYMYRLEDFNGEELEGNFYTQELQKTAAMDKIYLIEKVLDEKIDDKGQIWIKVRWKGFSKKFDQWILKKDTTDLEENEE